jgi:transcriptional regulator with XRE-family HTH domain
MIKLGKIIHAFRLEKGMTLKELAAKAEISVSYLSQIENDQVNMCLNVLESISRALDKPLSLFFLQDSIDSVSFVRKKERLSSMRADHAFSERLTDSRISKVDITIVTYPANYVRQELVIHQGEEFMLVLEGTLDVNLASLRIYHMEAGDSIAFSSRIPHSVISEKGAKVLIHSSTAPVSFI